MPLSPVRAACAAIAFSVPFAFPSPPPSPDACRGDVLQEPTDLLCIDAAAGTTGLPAGWRLRAVRGQRAPRVTIVDSAGRSFLRIDGSGQAGWLVRPVEPPIAPPGGHLHWTWRVPMAPRGTDLRDVATDDSALRVFVSFGPLRRFGPLPRTIFYSLGGPEPDGYAAPPQGRRDVFVVRVGAAAETEAWRRVRVDPFADYQRAWDERPPAIAVVGLFQDTDQTGDRAVADIHSLHWSPDDARFP